jgi:hypothetical protein
MVTAKQGLTSNAPRLCNPHGVASLYFSKVAEPLMADFEILLHCNRKVII